MIGQDTDLDAILGLENDVTIDTDTSATNIYQNMTRAWVNERAAPVLLPYQHKMVEELRSITETQQEELHSRYMASAASNFARFICGLELERIKFVLRSYLRLRLTKIQKTTNYLLSDPELRMCMSDEELLFAERFQNLVDTYHRASYIGQLPKTFQSLENDEMLMKPNLDDAVFCRVTQDVGDLQINDMETVLMKKDQMYLLRYSKIRPLVEDNKVDLL
ncbi:hypothetical protein BASA50_000503 [Batrachochytrium salamandrivorans]|uniref:DNA replication complex GINS protein SLD5 n=1 Tax=Batrachochytrium salamandrivorans TaxID=1357716 RepID=A0ABQ8EUF0_9FUNG|nr:hypothetical protein BASA60_011386 [Batrachochytrium salamandrivorans]KAH6568103.1 hypothetical protein BASA62_005650 [Batrachochytrium salamandrivorans]KAH6586549.1 hypothetical protein BASA50_000503 [Batrachochytrium salamandrivorans]KAH9275382.1 hypothetical protein BASA83_002155 [Batrachochytrium salamandrivorans]KAJ1345086.1 hypothetical protein BSLG_000601 [Batrachochytrium salamandrivorans]